jgi:hypothetical protein
MKRFLSFIFLTLRLVVIYLVIGFESGFSGFRGFLRVGVSWDFESGFTGF